MTINITDVGPQTNARQIYIDNCGYYLGNTICCAVVVIKQLKNSTPIEHIEEIIKIIRKETSGSPTGTGPTNILVFAHAVETDLMKNLESAGFKRLTDNVSRRTCYVRTALSMFIYTI